MASRRSDLARARQQAKVVTAEQGIIFEVHHRHPRSRKDSYEGRHIDEKDNLELVEMEIHRAYHRVFGNRTPDEVAALLTEKFIDRHYYLVAVPRKRVQHNKRRKRIYCVDCECEILKYLPKGGKDDEM